MCASNMIPREGGNRFSSSFIGIYANDGLQSTNYSRSSRHAGGDGGPHALTVRGT